MAWVAGCPAAAGSVAAGPAMGRTAPPGRGPRRDHLQRAAFRARTGSPGGPIRRRISEAVPRTGLEPGDPRPAGRSRADHQPAGHPLASPRLRLRHPARGHTPMPRPRQLAGAAHMRPGFPSPRRPIRRVRSIPSRRPTGKAGPGGGRSPVRARAQREECRIRPAGQVRPPTVARDHADLAAPGFPGRAPPAPAPPRQERRCRAVRPRPGRPSGIPGDAAARTPSRAPSAGTRVPRAQSRRTTPGRAMEVGRARAPSRLTEHPGCREAV